MLFVLRPSPNHAPRAKHKVGVPLRNVFGYHYIPFMSQLVLIVRMIVYYVEINPTQHLIQEDSHSVQDTI